MNAQFKKLSPRARAAAKQGADRNPITGFNCQTGKYIRDKAEIDLSGVSFLAIMASQKWGWLKFGADNKPVKIVGLVEDENFIPPERHELGDLDESLWPIGLSGKPDDPWKEVGSFDLVNLATGECVTFEQSSWLGRDAITQFGKSYELMAPSRPGQLPVVQLGTAVKKTTKGTKYRPTFTIVGWMPNGANESEPSPAIENAKVPLVQIEGPDDRIEDAPDDELPPLPPLEAYEEARR